MESSDGSSVSSARWSTEFEDFADEPESMSASGGSHCGSGDAPQPELTTAADRHYCQHAEILRHLQTVQDIAKNNINGHIGAQLSLTVAHIAKHEEKKLRAQLKGHPVVFRVMGQ